MQPAITKDKFYELCAKNPQRIILSKSLKKEDKSEFVGSLNFSFPETVQLIFETETGLSLWPSKSKYNSDAVWMSIKTDGEYEAVKKWVEKQGSTVFIRSLLRTCIALDVRGEHNEDKETRVGNLEKRAKKRFDGQMEWSPDNLAAIEELVQLLSNKIKSTAFYKDTKYIAAVPAADTKKLDVPIELARQVAKSANLIDITSALVYKGSKSPIKNAPNQERWDILEQSTLVFEPKNFDRIDYKGVILLDDKYQSGATMHYVAMVLQNAGFESIYGLTAVKTISN